MEPAEKKSPINILHIINVFLSYWLLIGISVALFLSIAFFYLRFASRTYEVYAKVSLKTDQGNQAKGATSYVNVNDMMNQEKDFTNKISYFTSTPMIEEVIHDMNLYTSYYLQEDKIPKEIPFSFINIYKESPILVIMDKSSVQPINSLFYLSVIDDSRFSINAYEPAATIYNFKINKTNKYTETLYLNGTYRFGDTIKNSICSFKVLLNSNYTAENYLGKDLFFKFNSPKNMAYQVQNSLQINTAAYQSSIAELRLEWDNLDLASEILENLIEKYIEKNLEKKNHNANNTLAYIDRQLSNIAGTLGQSEQQLQNFRTSRDVMDIGTKTSDISSQIRILESNRSELQTRYQNLDRLNNYFETYKDSSTFLAPSFVGMSDATLTTLIQELTALTTERQNLISTNQIKNVRLKTLEANISTIKKVISENISFSLSSTKAELDDLNQRINSLDREFALLPQTQRQLTGLEREFSINDAVYTNLLDRRIQAQIIKASNVSDCEIIEPVRYDRISSPSIMKIGVLALFFGFFFPMLYILFVNFLSQRIRSKEDISRFSTLSVLGSIPHNDKSENNVITNFPQSPIAERIHSIRSSLNYYLLGEKNKCILLTSTIPNEGKSFISLNLASSFATAQNKTLMLSFDLRKENEVQKVLGNTKDYGISSYLINEKTLDEIISPTNIPNLDTINSGVIPPDPAALLSTPKVAELFETLKSKYEYIIIDTPPYGLVTDAFLLMQHSDINIFISRLGTITKKPLKLSMEDIKTKEIKNIFHLLNDLKKIDKSYNEKYAYAYAKPSKNIFKRLFKRKK